MKPFQLHDENTGINHLLEILDTPGIENDEDMIEFFYDYMCDTDKMIYLESHYGVHDISYDDHLLFGFTSYEWPLHDTLDKLKSEWSEWLTDLGFTVGEWYE